LESIDNQIKQCSLDRYCPTIRVMTTFPDLADRFDVLLARIDHELAPLPTREDMSAYQDLVRQAKDIRVALSVMAAFDSRPALHSYGLSRKREGQGRACPS